MNPSAAPAGGSPLKRLLSHEHAARALAGGLAGATSAIFTAPLDLVKTIKQVDRQPVSSARTTLAKTSSTPSHFAGRSGAATSSAVYTHGNPSIVSILKRVVKREGARGLFKGLGCNLIAYVPNWALFFASYGWFKAKLGELAFFQMHDAARGSVTTQHPVLRNVAASSLAGVVTCCAINPLWVIKIRLQTQVGNHHYRGILHAFQKIARQEGIGGFYKGLPVAVMGVAHAMIQLPLYERLKVYFYDFSDAAVPVPVHDFRAEVAEGEAVGEMEEHVRRLREREVARLAQLELQQQQSRRDELQRADISNAPTTLATRYVLLSTIISKSVASTVAYPHEPVRSRLQKQRVKVHYTGVRHCVETMYKEEGFASFYKGLGTTLVRAVPNAAVTFVTQELAFRSIMDWASGGLVSASRNAPRD